MKKIEEALVTFGFDCTTSSDGVVTGYFFRRRKKNLDEIITVSGRKHGKGFTEYNVKMQIPRPCIAFPEVENLISEVTGDSPDNFYTVSQGVSKQVAEAGVKGLILDNFAIEVNADHEAERYCEFMHEVYNKYAVPFYERFQKLQNVDDYLTANPQDKDHLISNSGGNTALHRIVVIKYLCKNPGAQEYHRSVKDELQKKIDNKTIASMNEVLLKIEKKLGIVI